jgi:hypothetical protein
MEGMTDIEDLEDISRQNALRGKEGTRRGGKGFRFNISPNLEHTHVPREPKTVPAKPVSTLSIEPAPFDVEDLKTIAARARWSGVPLRSMADVLAAMRARRDEIAITFETLDSIAGWPCRYGSKLFSPEPVKNLGWSSLGLGLGALGTMLLMVEDEEQIRRVQDRWIRRERPQTSAKIEG